MAVVAGTKIVDSGLILNIDPANEKAVQTGNLEVEYLIVAGGGGGGAGRGSSGWGGAGGGAGGLLIGNKEVQANSYTVLVGGGGASRSTDDYISGGNGTNSSFDGITSFGGGGGASRISYGGTDAGDGGSGGGGVLEDQAGSFGSGTPGQGFDGGYSLGGCGRAGGGGGASSPGICATGGDGLYISFANAVGLGEAGYFAGGGGGGKMFGGTVGTGGIGGGGDGVNGSVSESGSVNTGGGGGGGRDGRDGGGSSGTGGSGIVVVRYKGPQKATGGDSVYQSGGYTVHVFNNSGNFVVGGAVGDVSGNNNGGAINGATYNAANQGYYSFDGTDDYITMGTKDIITNDFTVSMWVRPTATTKELYFFSFGYNDSTSALFFRTSGSPYTLAVIYLPNGSSVSNTAILANTTYNLVWTRSGSTNTFYVNNESVHTFTDSTSLVSSIYDIGWATTRNKATAYFQGNIYNTLLYNRALTADEVYENFEATRGRFGV